VETEDGFTFLVVRGPWTEDCRRFVSEGRVDALRLNYALGYQERSLEFLESWPLRRLDLLSRTTKDLHPLYRMAGTLEDLKITCDERVRLDLQRFPALTSLSIEWAQVCETLPFATSLRSLFLTGYDQATLEPTAALGALQSLRLKEIGRLEGLDGIGNLGALSVLHVIGARHLRDIATLTSCALSLTEVNVDSSLRRVESLDDVRTLTRLKKLNVSNAGSLDSLAPLAEMSELETLYAYEKTTVLDGNLGPLLGLGQLSDLRMMNRQHYRPTVRQVIDALPLHAAR
jgi:Leucine-rich repeat (LRR) protein